MGAAGGKSETKSAETKSAETKIDGTETNESLADDVLVNVRLVVYTYDPSAIGLSEPTFQDPLLSDFCVLQTINALPLYRAFQLWLNMSGLNKTIEDKGTSWSHNGCKIDTLVSVELIAGPDIPSKWSVTGELMSALHRLFGELCLAEVPVGTLRDSLRKVKTIDGEKFNKFFELLVPSATGLQLEDSLIDVLFTVRRYVPLTGIFGENRCEEPVSVGLTPNLLNQCIAEVTGKRAWELWQKVSVLGKSMDGTERPWNDTTCKEDRAMLYVSMWAGHNGKCDLKAFNAHAETHEIVGELCLAKVSGRALQDAFAEFKWGESKHLNSFFKMLFSSAFAKQSDAYNTRTATVTSSK